jgi:hypothetical protein
MHHHQSPCQLARGRLRIEGLCVSTMGASMVDVHAWACGRPRVGRHRRLPTWARRGAVIDRPLPSVVLVVELVLASLHGLTRVCPRRWFWRPAWAPTHQRGMRRLGAHILHGLDHVTEHGFEHALGEREVDALRDDVRDCVPAAHTVQRHQCDECSTHAVQSACSVCEP